MLAQALDSRRGASRGHRANAEVVHREFLRLVHDIPASRVRPADVRAYRDSLVGRGLTMRTVCDRLQEIRSCFRWASEYELVNPAQANMICAVRGPRAGEAEPNAKREPVDPKHIRAVLPHLPDYLQGIVIVLVVTGARVGEIRLARATDLDAQRRQLRPSRHKNARRGLGRTIDLPEAAFEVIRGAMSDMDDAPSSLRYIFSPDRGWSPYTGERLRRELYDACGRAGVPEFKLAQLRHTAASIVANTLGIDHAADLLGHADTSTTSKHYASSDRSKAQAASEHLTTVLGGLQPHKTNKTSGGGEP